ncbi:MAG: carbohydrate kinase family protein [Candidatus Nanoarchaeia archaeon]|jgi:ribokinase
MLDVLSVGNANVDLIVNSDKIISAEPLVMPGGSACNFAVGCARLGLKAGFLGYTGKDSFGELIKASLKRERVMPFIKVVDEHTGLVLVFTKKRFKKFIKYAGANKRLELLRISQSAKHLHLATPPLSLLKQARGSVSVDPGASLSKYSLAELKPYLSKINVFLPNEAEAKAITGHSYKKAANDLLSAGIKIVIIKLGRGGCYLKTSDESIRLPSIDYPAVDTTGAGDAFDSAFISAWLKGKLLREACQWGIISSNVCVTRLGAQNSATMKELNAIKALLKTY